MKWYRILPLLYLLATFEHCYKTFELYNGGLNFPKVITVLLVLAIDSSIYFSMQVFHLMPARIILVLAGLISVTLNVKYMVDWETRWSIWIDHWNSVWNPYTAHVVPVRVVGEGSEPAAFHEWHEWNTNLERRDPLLFREVSR